MAPGEPGAGIGGMGLGEALAGAAAGLAVGIPAALWAGRVPGSLIAAYSVA